VNLVVDHPVFEGRQKLLERTLYNYKSSALYEERAATGEGPRPRVVYQWVRRKNVLYNRRPIGRCSAVSLDRAAQQYFREGLLLFIFSSMKLLQI
jgi:hypothetical protein